MGCCATKSSSRETLEFADKSSCCEKLVFADKKYDFRIPALLYFKEWNTFLAFAEKRTSTNDAHAMNLVMSKGTRDSGSLKWSPTEDVKEAAKDGYRTMNPCPVFERNSTGTGGGTLFLFFICIKGKTPERKLKPGQTRLCYVTSTDLGVTWSDLTDLTESVNFTNYQTFAVGPGHGIQLSSGTLLVPAYVKEVEGCRQCQSCWCCCGNSEYVSAHAVVLRSEDLNTWKAGQPIALESLECQLAEVSDGKGGTQVYLNARSIGAPEPRVEALSNDGGASFTRLNQLTLKERPHGCQGSVLGFPASDIPAGGGGSSETALLFSHPTKGEDWNRLDLGVYLRKSLQDDDPWGIPHIIHKGPSGYSDLTGCEEERQFGCLMECGHGERLQIVFKEINHSDVDRGEAV
ncbi:sialidase-4-like [Clupea harengus]|uniref:exo-alpha-sialidase n=1 Tax=Clupea harengus TaxID=7950 RepID=A0A6P8FBH7_CLUHA|nr:sialidase-4-like [Clupea harengus]XP_042563624.1 sialidase-4-like [Clupea harengus]